MAVRTHGWFRVGSTDRGNFVMLDPKVPSRASVDEDKTIPRIPVCADIGQCLVAITTLHLRDHMFVYRASQTGENGRRRRLALDYESPRKLVPDWEDTEEVWMETVGFEKVGEIEIVSGILNVPEIKWRWKPRGKWRVAKP